MISAKEPIFPSSSASEPLRNILENEGECVPQSFTRVNELLRDVDKQRKTMRFANALPPIKQVPPEILIEVFMGYIDLHETYEVCTEEKDDDEDDKTRLTRASDPVPAKDFYQDLPYPLLLSQVCAQWRSVVQNAPRLWTRIYFRVCHGKFLPDKQLVHEWFQRSGSLPIDIGICVSKSVSRQSQNEFLKCLVMYSERWRSLALQMKIDSIFYRPPLSLPNLQQVIIPFPNHIRPQGNAFRDATKLTRVEIFSNRSIESMPPSYFPVPLSNITVLCLRYLFGEPDCFRDFMLACPLLETCELLQVPDFRGDGLDIQMSFTPARFPFLKNFTLEFEGWVGSPQILNNLCLPKLESFVLRRRTLDSVPFQFAFMPYLVKLQKRSGFQLRKFVFRLDSGPPRSAPPDTVDGLVDFLKLNPTLEDLDLEDCRFNIPLLCRKLTVDSHSSALEPLVPNLIRLRIAQTQRMGKKPVIRSDYRDGSRGTDGDIADMVLSRWNPPQRPEQGDINNDTTAKGTLVKRLKEGFTFEAYSRKLSPGVLSRLKDCEAEGMPLQVMTGKRHFYDQRSGGQ
ncbi:hypothetical protein K435DRAFT_837389 [Dendrothele bispora CBS 962.96]|uniref:Uncharacterized protein n=1 Tax=Dendrothele bispora (strain CBS 962.96) TaxID=1314807 RepID=A0A4S8MD60_DENBC|nr:hypothetical protein K435DRAFT_837389 [Dendrothele bispora CBS 962.96]